MFSQKMHPSSLKLHLKIKNFRQKFQSGHFGFFRKSSNASHADQGLGYLKKNRRPNRGRIRFFPQMPKFKNVEFLRFLSIPHW